MLFRQIRRRVPDGQRLGPDGAVQDQIDDTVTDGVLRARAHIPKDGPDALRGMRRADPEARRRALPASVPPSLPVALDRRPVQIGFNRRGSKDSQAPVGRAGGTR